MKGVLCIVSDNIDNEDTADAAAATAIDGDDVLSAVGC